MSVSLIALNLHKFSFVSRQKKDDSQEKKGVIRAKHDLNIHNLQSKFLIVAQQLLNCQLSLFGAARAERCLHRLCRVATELMRSIIMNRE